MLNSTSIGPASTRRSIALSQAGNGTVTHQVKPACHPSVGVGHGGLPASVQTFCTSSRRPETGRTCRRGTDSTEST